ncbi:MAG: SlyX family protein [Lentisphaeraceae bacterium]|nr:SlyX family protein [Lentisphaeraceae bacterium]
MSEDLEERINKLEVILSYQDQTLEDLNDVVLAQQKQIDSLERELKKFQNTLSSLGEEVDNRPPPHY